MTEFNKKLLTLRQYLLGARYHSALRALEFAMAHHDGFRKDKVTPEFDHQVSIALYAITLPDIMYREELIAAIMLHDVREDYAISDLEIRALFSDPVFRERVANAVEALTKKTRGKAKPVAEYFEALALDPIASIAKGCDRSHNMQTMVGVFTVEKQQSYIGEAELFFLPMLKKARRNFPEQTLAYENIKHVLKSQIQLIAMAHDNSTV